MGKNHYYDGKHFVTPKLEDEKVTKWVLNKMNEINGLVVEQYGDCYIDDSWGLDFVTKKDYSSLPTLTYLDTTGWKISNSEEDLRNDYLPYLLDNDATTSWSSWPSTEGVRKMQITVDMTKEQTVNGVKVVQTSDTETQNYPLGKAVAAHLEKVERIMEGKIAPDFSLATAENDTISLHKMKGKVKLVDFWASWCGPCRQEMPNLVKLYKHYQTKGLEILGVSIDDKAENWAKYITDTLLSNAETLNPVTYSQAIKSINANVLNDFLKRLSRDGNCLNVTFLSKN